jgi:hypothetical protein
VARTRNHTVCAQSPALVARRCGIVVLFAGF